MNPVIWLTGHSGSGKTTIARMLAKEIDAIILDGDEMRASISLDAGFSREDRAEHNLRVARLAKVLSAQKTVIVSVIAPMIKTRSEIEGICNPFWIYCKRDMEEREGHFYEEPNGYYTIEVDSKTPKEHLANIASLFRSYKVHSLFIGRWQPIHDGHLKLFDQVRKEGRQILIGIRRTRLGPDNPYSVFDRIEMIKEKVPDADIVVIPDITEIVYGRGVGYGIREVRLDDETENISATRIRKEKDAR